MDIFTESGIHNSHAYADLGLPSATLWAVCNVGASCPHDFGGHFSWGETVTKDFYDWSNCKYSGGSETSLSKYCHLDGRSELDSLDDAASVNWGGSWHTPSIVQFDELFRECYCVWTDCYNSTDVPGYIVYKAKSLSDRGVVVNRNKSASPSYSFSDVHIFLPAAGHRYAGSLRNAGSAGVYWTSSLHADSPAYAWFVDFNSFSVDRSYFDRCYASSVRPVCTSLG